ncbi:MAG: indole-3-glycerol phosphate synthase TrpC [Candidatus Firestonebacteria bacterium]
MNVLNEIVRCKHIEVKQLYSKLSILYAIKKIKDLSTPRNFKSAISKSYFNLIAEVKKKSPSAGIISRNFNLVKISKMYELNGASAISVLTDKKFFGGSISYLSKAKNKTNIPILRKDFIIDELQIYESRLCGADAILLIVSILDKIKLKKFLKIATSLKLTPIVEVHNKSEINIALDCGAQIIGINNRNLVTFKVDIKTTAYLRKFIPKEILVVSESGIHTKFDIDYLKKFNLNAILVGEALMRNINFIKQIV